MAAKLEEIYPPKLGDFAYVTDGACKEHEILEKEIIVLKVGSLCESFVFVLKQQYFFLELNKC